MPINADELKAFCLTFPGAYEDYPFDDVTPVIKVSKKMFALFGDGSVSLKCDPLLSGNLRRQYAAVTPGYHLNKEHWNTIKLDGSVPDDTVRDLTEMSFRLVLKPVKKPKAAPNQE